MPPTYTSEPDFRQERDFGQKITATFEFLGAHWKPLGRVVLYLVMPLALLQGIVGAVLQSEIMRSVVGFPTNPRMTRSPFSAFGMYSTMFHSPTYYLNSFVSLAFHAVLILAVYGYVLHCLSPTASGQPILPGQVWETVKQKFIGTFFSLMGIGFIVGLGTLVFVIPGIYLLVALSIFFIVKVVENTGFGATINRCISLTKGKWWSTAGLLFVISVILWMLLVGFGIFWGLVNSLVGGIVPITVGDLPLIQVVMGAITPLLTLFLYLPLLIALAFQYFNLVERNEGVGMYHLVGQLGQAAPAGPSADAYRPVEEGEY